MSMGWALCTLGMSAVIAVPAAASASAPSASAMSRPMTAWAVRCTPVIATATRTRISPAAAVTSMVATIRPAK
jgi:hypothetical protein